MKLRIVKQPTGVVGGIRLDHYHPGRVYEVATTIADYLVVEGFAVVEMRDEQRTIDRPAINRRKKP